VKVRTYDPAAGWRAGVLLLVSVFLGFTPSVGAQCRPGDVLVGEDEHAYYCEVVAKYNEVVDVLSEIKDYFLNPPNEELLGNAWRIRKAVIDTAGCVAKAKTQYEFGSKFEVSDDCINSEGKKIDCSGLTGYSDEVAGCAVSAVYSASTNTLAGLNDKNAAGQWQYFKAHNALSNTGNPGDSMFFRGTYPSNKGISHVGIYLGTDKKGKTFLIHASSGSGGVIVTSLSDSLRRKLAGYGNISKLFRDLNSH
jgi:hypothetical protein